MPLQRIYLFLRLNIPQLNHVVVAARSQILAVRREYNTQDAIAVPLQSSYLALLLDTPQLDRIVAAARSQILAISR